MPKLILEKVAPALVELADHTFHRRREVPGKYMVTLEVSAEALEELTVAVAALRSDVARTRGQSRPLRARLARLEAQREFLFRLGWEVSRHEAEAPKPEPHQRG